jgi:hypothetical protein
MAEEIHYDAPRTDKLLLLNTVAGSAATVGAAKAVESILSKKAAGRQITPPPRQNPIALTEAMEAEAEYTQRARRTAQHPQKRWSESQWQNNPNQMKSAVKSGRLTRAAAKARSRMGGLGMMLGLPAAVMDYLDIEKEGGPRAARLGKFVERATGFPSGTLNRPMTDKEKETALSI